MKVALLSGMVALVVASGAAGATGPPASGIVQAATGAGLYAANCSSCHGPHGQGVGPPGRPGVGNIVGLGPSLIRVGAEAADFYLRTGYMPLADPHTQPSRSPVLFSNRQISQLVAYIASFGPGPAIPDPRPAKGSLAQGFALFGDHCAGCHQIAAQGGYVTDARVPALNQANDREIAEAIRVGPDVMPKFSERAISDGQVDSIIRYLDYAKHPDDAGGWSIGRIGPVPEGLVTWLLAAAALVAVCLLVSRRAHHE